MDPTKTTIRATQPARTGLRRPDYGPMQQRVLKNFPTTPHVTKRRTVLDESMLEALHHTHIGPLASSSGIGSGSGSGSGSGGEINSRSGSAGGTGSENSMGSSTGEQHQQQHQQAVGGNASSDQFWTAADPPAGSSSFMPQTPRRESRTYTIPPGSGRRTSRRRSRSSNQHLRTTPLKALADANQARVNRLISEANRQGRVGRDKHSPMGILRLLSRIPGFNPPPPSVPERQPIPGSSNWKKLTPKATRTNHINIPDDPNSVANPFSTSNNQSAHQLASAERRAFDRFRDQNPFLDSDDFNNLWEAELARRGGGRDSFGQSATRDGGRMFLEGEDGDTRDFSLTLGELDDPFADLGAFDLAVGGLKRRSINIGDITNTSMTGFDQRQGQEGQGGQDKGQDMSEELLRAAQGLSGQPYMDSLTEQDQTSQLSDPNAISLGLSTDQLATEEAQMASTGEPQIQSGPLGFADQLSGGLSVEPMDPNEAALRQLLEQDLDINMEDGWEDIPEDETGPQGTLEQQFQLELQQQQRQQDQGRDQELQQPLMQSTLGDSGDGEVDLEEMEIDMNAESRAFAEMNLTGQQGELEQEKKVAEQELALAEADADQRGGDRALAEEDFSGEDGATTEDASTGGEGLASVEDMQNRERGSENAMNQEGDTHDALNQGRETEGAADQGEEPAMVEEEERTYEDGYMNVNEEEHIEQFEHEEEQQDRPGVHYFDDFPSELGIMSNGEVLPTSLPAIKRSQRMSAKGLPVPSMPMSLQKQLVHTFSRSRISQEAMAVILEGSHTFFEQAANDLAAYAEHGGRRTIDESDVECLMKRLRIVNEKVSMESLLQRYLPRELRDKVLFPEQMQKRRRR